MSNCELGISGSGNPVNMIYKGQQCCDEKYIPKLPTSPFCTIPLIEMTADTYSTYSLLSTCTVANIMK